MAPSHRALWKSLPTEWQSMLRSAHNLDGPPERRQLADIFSASSLDLYPPDGVALSARFDLAPLQHFPALEWLDVAEGIDLDTLPPLPRLTTLRVHAPSLPDDLGARVPALQHLTLVPQARHARALRGLGATEAEVVTGEGINLAVLAQMPRLRALVMSDGPADQVPQLAAFGRLTHLDLRYTRFSNLAPLAALRRLRALDLSCTDVFDLAPLAGLTTVKLLSLFGCEAVTELAPLASLTALRALDLTDTGVRSLAPLSALTALKTLRLDGSKVDTLRALKGLSALTELGAPDTAVHDLRPLSSLAGLRQLDLRATPVRDLRPLHALPRLREVNLDQSEVGWAEGEALEAALCARHPAATVVFQRKPLGDFRGPLDAAAYAELEALLAASRIQRESGAFYVSEVCVARPGDWHYAVTRTAFDAAQSLLTLWLDVSGYEVPLRLWSPRDVRVGAEEFRVGGASRVVLGTEDYPTDARTAFRLG